VSSEIELPLVEAAVRVGITIDDRRETVDRTVQAGVKPSLPGLGQRRQAI